MRIIGSLGLACLLGLSCAGSSFAITRYVNVSNAAPAAPYTNWANASTNIQLAINAAASGDEIQVAPGAYRIANSVDIPANKRLTLRSTVSRSAVIDAQQWNPALVIRGTNSLVEGFTVRNGMNASYGGGIILYSAGTVRDCLVVSNQAYGGAGIHISHCAGVVENCTIQNNLATYMGGGVLFYNYATGLVNNCVISDNVASNYGGGVYCQYAGTVSNSLIVRNWAKSGSSGSGGGVYIERSGRLVNSVVVTNRAEVRGGGVYATDGATLAHCTVVDNRSIGEGGGLWIANSSTSWNNIVYYNEASITNNISSYSSVVSNCCATPNMGGSNFTNAPLFVNRTAWNFRLAAGSPCIDAGATNPAVAVDYEGTVRPQIGTSGGSARYDVGAFEFSLPAATVLNIAPAGTNILGFASSGRHISVTANGLWSAATNRSWISITAGAVGSTNGTVTFSVASNSTAFARTGTITVTGGAIVRTCTVIQTTGIVTTYYLDADGDGFGGSSHLVMTTLPPAGYVANNTDWNDNNASVYPGAPEISDGLDNNGDGQIDEGARVGKTCFSLAQSVGCTGAGWSRTFVMDLTNFRNIAVQDGYQSYTVSYLLYYNIWTGIYLFDYDAGAFSALTWLTNLDL